MSTGSDVMVWMIFFLTTLGTLTTSWESLHCCCLTGRQLCMLADQYTFFWWLLPYGQCAMSQSWFLEHCNTSIVPCGVHKHQVSNQYNTFGGVVVWDICITDMCLCNVRLITLPVSFIENLICGSIKKKKKKSVLYIERRHPITGQL